MNGAGIATNRLARLLAAALDAKNITRRYTSGMINIFIGSHLFTEKTSKTTSAASVIMNSEIVDIHMSLVISCNRSASITFPISEILLF